MSQSTLSLAAGPHETIRVQPKFGQRFVHVSGRAFTALCRAQALVSPDVQFVLVRGYQLEGMTQKFLRWVGRKTFILIYPSRQKEADYIFDHNGHSTDGNHLDIRLQVKHKTLNLLPLNVFTPLFIVNHSEARYREVLAASRSALVRSGFHIHPNSVEALQLHCDFANL